MQEEIETHYGKNGTSKFDGLILFIFFLAKIKLKIYIYLRNILFPKLTLKTKLI